MTSSVEAEPAFWIVISTAWAPSTRTMLICGGAAVVNEADIAHVDDTVPLTDLTGSRLSSSIVDRRSFIETTFNSNCRSSACPSE